MKKMIDILSSSAPRPSASRKKCEPSVANDNQYFTIKEVMSENFTPTKKLLKHYLLGLQTLKND